MDGKLHSSVSWPELRSRDRHLVARCLRGDEVAWDAVWDHYGPLVKSVALRQGCDHEEGREVLQRVALVALERLDQLKNPAKLGGWLAGVARFQALAVIRERSGATALAAAEEPSTLSHEDAVARDQELFRLRHAMQQLDDRCRRLITRLDLQDPVQSYAEVAAAEGLAPSSIGPIRRRCLERLRKFLEKVSR